MMSLIRNGDFVLRHVGISEMAMSRIEKEVLATYSLGSCIGLSLYDPVARVAGLIHCMLPSSTMDPAKALEKPAMFVDKGVVVLLQRMLKHGARKRRLVAKVAGAASPLDDKGLFKIGVRNYTVMRKLLWLNNILISAEEIGGTDPRTMYLHVGTGRVVVRVKGREIEL